MYGSLGLNTQRLKDGLKKYGRTGVATYLAVSFMVTGGARDDLMSTRGMVQP